MTHLLFGVLLLTVDALALALCLAICANVEILDDYDDAIAAWFARRRNERVSLRALERAYGLA